MKRELAVCLQRSLTAEGPRVGLTAMLEASGETFVELMAKRCPSEPIDAA